MRSTLFTLPLGPSLSISVSLVCPVIKMFIRITHSTTRLNHTDPPSFTNSPTNSPTNSVLGPCPAHPKTTQHPPYKLALHHNRLQHSAEPWNTLQHTTETRHQPLKLKSRVFALCRSRARARSLCLSLSLCLSHKYTYMNVYIHICIYIYT